MPLKDDDENGASPPHRQHSVPTRGAGALDGAAPPPAAAATPFLGGAGMAAPAGPPGPSGFTRREPRRIFVAAAHPVASVVERNRWQRR
jgi:hypothetical protein